MNQDENRKIVAVGSLAFSHYIKFNIYRQRNFFSVVSITSLPLFAIIYSGIHIIDFSNLSMIDYLLILFSSLIYTLLILLGIFIRNYKEYKNDSLIKKEVTYIITNNGVSQVNRTVTANYTWNDFIKIKESKEMFFLFLSPTRAIVIPKNFFKNNIDINSFKTLINNND
ncbi:YcxB family protein [Carnobacterium inhibens]|uniref:YcxB-like C-terminal domain-containing protein n=2 Tax=Carnobacterium inhibens TaxID=147709 RepID=U5SFS8_9LACT|nr:YcxB family protein [Carnobacterium inhibens]AGY82968.1 hypothetical protein Q783_11700 [Carnobacterium inhibens subsp. gilichinskyi]MBC9826232.1 hypothetical protein [Carnobacterium inhibens]